MGMMKELESTSSLFGSNAPFIEGLYERYLADPASVDAEWRGYFDELRGGAPDVAHAPVVDAFVQLAQRPRLAASPGDMQAVAKQVLVLRLISKYRTLGFFAADLDPLQREAPPYIPDLDLRTYGFTEADMDTEFDVGSLKAGPQQMKLRDIVAMLRETYVRTLGLEYMYIADTSHQALLPAAHRTGTGACKLYRRATPPCPRTADGGRKRWNATCTPSMSGRNASRVKAATR